MLLLSFLFCIILAFHTPSMKISPRLNFVLLKPRNENSFWHRMHESLTHYVNFLYCILTVKCNSSESMYNMPMEIQGTKTHLMATDKTQKESNSALLCPTWKVSFFMNLFNSVPPLVRQMLIFSIGFVSSPKIPTVDCTQHPKDNRSICLTKDDTHFEAKL